jgi:[ribosomal protein S5]-alanine N-acetyltransferase
MDESQTEWRGAKVILRPFTEADLTETYLGWLNDPEVVRFSNQRFTTHGQESCRRYLQAFEGAENLFLLIQCQATGRPVGTMTCYCSPPHGTVDMGILIGEKTFWGQGYGQDAWDTLGTWWLQRGDVRKLTAGTVACNHGMIRLMERSGMALEAVRKTQEIVEGELCDVLYYAKFNER